MLLQPTLDEYRKVLRLLSDVTVDQHALLYEVATVLPRAVLDAHRRLELLGTWRRDAAELIREERMADAIRLCAEATGASEAQAKALCIDLQNDILTL